MSKFRSRTNWPWGFAVRCRNLPGHFPRQRCAARLRQSRRRDDTSVFERFHSAVCTKHSWLPWAFSSPLICKPDLHLIFVLLFLVFPCAQIGTMEHILGFSFHISRLSSWQRNVNLCVRAARQCHLKTDAPPIVPLTCQSLISNYKCTTSQGIINKAPVDKLVAGCSFQFPLQNTSNLDGDVDLRGGGNGDKARLHSTTRNALHFEFNKSPHTKLTLTDHKSKVPSCCELPLLFYIGGIICAQHVMKTGLCH